MIKVYRLLAALAASLACAQCQAQDAIVDSTVSLQRMVDQAYLSGKKSVVIPPGAYRVSADAGIDKRHCFVFAKMRDFTIHAKDVTFVNTTRGRGTIDFLRCTNVTLDGLTIRHEVPAASQGTITVIAADRRSVDVQISAGYPADLDDQRYFAAIPVIDVYEAHQDILKPGAPDIYISSLERLGPTAFRFHLANALPPSPSVEAGDRVAWRGTVAADVHLYLTGSMKLIGVTIESSPGFCVQEEAGDGGNYYNYTVTYGPTPPNAIETPLISSNADAFNSDGLRRGPTLWNCAFEGMNDDGIPIHSAYALAGGSDGSAVYLDMMRRPADVDAFRVGDHVRFYDNRKMLAGDAVVSALTEAKDYAQQDLHAIEERAFATQARQLWYKVTLDRPVSAQRGWLACDADAADDDFLVHGCTIRNARGRGMLVNAGYGVIEKCTIEHLLYGGIAIAPETSVWTQGDYAHDLIIRDNTIRDTSIITPCNFGGAALTVAAYSNGAYVLLPGGHRNVTITGNTFEDNSAVNILVSSTQGITISGNQFVRPLEAPGSWPQTLHAAPGALIWITQSNGVAIKDNTVIEPGSELKTFVNADGTVTGTGLTDGVSAR